MKTIKAAAAVSLVIVIVLWIGDISQAVSQAMLRCINIIIPSLFIMMIASRYIVAKNMLSPLEKLLKPICIIAGINERMMSVFILSNIGGYPIGASMLAQMRERGQITKKDAEVAAAYCFGSGPAFIIGAVGLCVYNSRLIGNLMFVSGIVANLIACIIYNRVLKTDLRRCFVSDDNNITYNLTDAITDSGRALFIMCSVIISFSVVNVAVDKIGELIHTDLSLISPLFEVTNVTSQRFAHINLAPTSIAFVSLGGICVWLQNAALAGKSFSTVHAFLLRIPVSLLSSAIFMVLYSRFSDSYLSTNADYNDFVVNIDNFLPSICLIIMIFILINKKRLAFLLKV